MSKGYRLGTKAFGCFESDVFQVWVRYVVIKCGELIGVELDHGPVCLKSDHPESPSRFLSIPTDPFSGGVQRFITAVAYIQGPSLLTWHSLPRYC